MGQLALSTGAGTLIAVAAAGVIFAGIVSFVIWWMRPLRSASAKGQAGIEGQVPLEQAASMSQAAAVRSGDRTPEDR